MEYPSVANGYFSENKVYDLEQGTRVIPAVSSFALAIEQRRPFRPEVYVKKIGEACKGDKSYEPATLIITDASLAGQISR